MLLAQFNSKKKAITLAGFLIAYTLAINFECKGTKFSSNDKIFVKCLVHFLNNRK